MRRLLLVLLLITPVILAAEGNFQINSATKLSSYPLPAAGGGNDFLRVTAAGVGIKSTMGRKNFVGVADVLGFVPIVMEEQVSPADSFASRAIPSGTFGMEMLLGMGYRFDLSPLYFIVSLGAHLEALMGGANYLLAVGMALDAQAYVRFGKVLTAQVGGRFVVDFIGTQNFSSVGSNFAGVPLNGMFYAGLGVNF